MSLLNNFQWSLIKPIMILTFVMGLTACGYQPLYSSKTTSSNASVREELSKFWIYDLEDREGQLLHNELLHLFQIKGSARKPEYFVKLSYEEVSSGIGIDQDEFATRANLRITSVFTVTGKDEFSGKSETLVSFNILNSPTGTEFSERDVRKRAIKAIANDIHRKIAVHLSQTTKR